MVRLQWCEDTDVNTAWDPLTVDEIAERFDPYGVAWWIAGGWAIDCFLGWETRPHDDIDVEMFRADRDVLSDVFAGWELFTVSSGTWTPWCRGSPIAPEVFGIWGRPSKESPWRVEILLADGDDDRWRFRRDPAVNLARDALIRYTSSGIPYCTPEVQLLYKAKMARPKDDVDLARCLHHMGTKQRRWLAEAIERIDPQHAWIRVLEIATRSRDE